MVVKFLIKGDPPIVVETIITNVLSLEFHMNGYLLKKCNYGKVTSERIYFEYYPYDIYSLLNVEQREVDQS